nr:alpha-endosulfine isoform X2 [Gorilla gorilla gorilla]
MLLWRWLVGLFVTQYCTLPDWPIGLPLKPWTLCYNWPSMDVGRVVGKTVNGKGMAGGLGCDVCYWFVEDTQEKEGILPERAEEAKLKAKYPSLGQKPGGSDFLMKRLQKGVWGIVSYPLSLEPKEVLRMKSVEVLLDPFLEVLLLNRSRG